VVARLAPPAAYGGLSELLRVMPLAQRRICGLCGRAFAIVFPPGEPMTERDKLCPYCARLPAQPDEWG